MEFSTSPASAKCCAKSSGWLSISSGKWVSSAPAICACNAWRGPRKQCAVGSILDKRVLEQERGIRKCATLKNQTCVNQPAEGILQYCLAALRDRGQQLIGEV